MYIVLLDAKVIVTILNNILRTFSSLCACTVQYYSLLLVHQALPLGMQKQARPPRHSTVFPHNICISNTSVLLAADKQLRAELDDCIEYISCWIHHHYSCTAHWTRHYSSLSLSERERVIVSATPAPAYVIKRNWTQLPRNWEFKLELTFYCCRL